MAALHAAFAQGEPSPLPALPLQYADFAAWQRARLQGEVLAGQLAWWRERLAGAPVLELPGDRPRPPVQSFRGEVRRSALSPALSAALAALAPAHGASLFMVLLAGFGALLVRWTGQEDVVVGTPIAGRGRPELEGLIGFFVNSLVLRTDLGGDPTAAAAIARVRETAVGAYAHQDLPFEQLVEELQPRRDLSRNPLFQILFNLLGTPPGRVESGGLAVSRLETAGGTALFDLQVYLVESGHGIATAWEYATDLFEAATVERLAGGFAALLAGIAADPVARLSELPLLGEAERAQLLVEWNATARAVPAGCVHERIAAQAARSPDAVAVVCGAETLTYRGLARAAGGWAGRLRALGVGPEVRVGVALERSPEMVVGLLAVLAAGGAYVPLDPALPAERLAFLLADAGVVAVLTRGAVRPRLPDFGGAWVLLEPGARPESVPAVIGARVGPDLAAYVIYTSGSTGWPKGVQVSHGALANFLASMAERPGLGAGDTLLAVTSLSFDIAGLELFLPLVVGGRVVVASREEAADGGRLGALIAACGATALQATPATWRLLLEAGWQGGEGLVALCGGEALPPALAAGLLDRVGALWNLYGPTETTVWSTVEELRPGAAVTIGRPIANTAAYVLDRRGSPVPLGALGELCLGGAGLARGYLGRPELTAERFVPDPFGPPGPRQIDPGSRAGARLYRTGDLARCRPDGRLECLGRLDHQVKVRGFRIEPGEVEAVLGRHPGVAAAVVAVREDAAGERQLVAWVVPRDAGLAPRTLRAWARQSLPEPLVPAVWVQRAALPLTPNGKVDRKALLAELEKTDLEAGERLATAPRTPTEQVLAALWTEMLGVAAVGAEDSFFDLGGHSLLATRVAARVFEAFGVELPLRTLFERPTLAGLARAIEEEGDRERAVPPLVRAPRPAHLPLSFGQQRLWFLHRLEPASPAYNIPFGARLRGRLDGEVLERACGEIVRRHEALRTTFRLAGGEPVQEVHPAAPFRLAAVDLASLPPAEREEEARRLAAAQAGRPFDLERGPLLRTLLVRLAEEEHLLLLTLHHIVSDGWSFGVLLGELAALYRAGAAGEPSPLPALPVQYADFALWQRAWLRGRALDELLAWWRERLAGAPPVLALPADRPRPAVQRFRGGRLRVALAAGAVRRLQTLARERGATLYMGLLAAFGGLLRRLTSQDDLVVGTPIAGRRQVAAEGLIGLFLNTLALRLDLPGDPTFGELLDRAREVALQAYAHQDLPFERLVDELDLPRDLSHSPLLQVLLVLQNAPLAALAPVELPGLALLPWGGGEGTTAKLDLVVNLGETAAGGLAGVWIYHSDLFDRATVARWYGHFERLLAGAVGTPERRLSEVALLSDPERQQLLEWNATAAVERGERGLYQLFAAQAACTPDAVAVVQGEARLTYGELSARALGVARRLCESIVWVGSGQGLRVGLAFERSPELVIGLLGIVAAGGTYVPIDPAYPEERREFMRRDAGLVAVEPSPPDPLSHPHTHPPGEGAPPPAGPSASHLEGVVVPPLPGGRECGWERGPGGEGPLYLIYTSGSTGQPKGAVVYERAFADLVHWYIDELGLTAADRLLLLSSASFDLTQKNFFAPLLVGAELHLAPPVYDPAALRALIERQGITRLNCTPSTFYPLVEEGDPADDPAALGGLASLRTVVLGGEPIAAGRLDRWRRSAGCRTAVLNSYGPTECTDVVACHRLAPPDEVSAVPLGRPLPGVRLWIAGGEREPAPLGVPGELWIGGGCVGGGYLGDPVRTALQFRPDPWPDLPGARLYRTGDLARRLPNGEVESLGRIDHQVKVRGFRIELGEIEAALAAHPAVRAAAVVAREGAAGSADRRLVAYLVPEAGSRVAPAELRAFLARSLPEPMLPAGWVALDALPLTASGKVDRRALPPEAALPPPAGGRLAPRDELERFLAGLWQEHLGLIEVGIRDDFFALGGNSISGAVLVNRVQERLGEIVHVVVLFDAPTVEAMAAHLAREHAAAVHRIFGRISGRRFGRAPGTGPAEGARRVGAAEVARFQALLPPPPAGPPPAVRNPPAVFVLSPPRSGSTLLRVLLGGHPRLFAPPELELLEFATLAERRAAFPGRDSFLLEGALRALMEVHRCAAAEAAALMAELEAEGLTTAELYRHLQDRLGERILVDKTPTYALDPAVLRRAEELFEVPFYVHLVRHPHGAIRSFEEAKLDQVFFRREHRFARRELAELAWLVSHRNIADFLAAVPAHRQHQVRFEDLVADPEATLRRLCAALGLDYHPAMAEPYAEPSARMTDGLHAASRMLGDVKFHQHTGIDRAAAERWRGELEEDFLGDLTWEMAERFGYVREPAGEPARAAAVPPLAPVSRAGSLPLSFAQQRLWILDRLDPGSAAYNIVAALRVDGQLDGGALAAALDRVAGRHEALRTTFGEEGGEPVQRVHSAGPAGLRVEDLSAIAEPERTDAARQLALQTLGQPFDLARGPLLRALLVRLGEREHVLLFALHHIVADGWSMGVLVRETAACYRELVGGAPAALRELPVQYADYAVWQRAWLQGEALAEQVAFWRERLAGAPALLRLPADRPRPAVQRFRGERVAVRVPAAVGASLRAVGQRRGATPFMALLAAFAVLLRRHGGQEDVVVGTPVANRDRAEIEGLIGCFVNTLPLRVTLAGNPVFGDLLVEVRATTLGAFAHQGLPFEKMVVELQPERDLSSSPLFQVMFALQNVPTEALSLPDLELRPVEAATGTAKFDLTLTLTEGTAGVAGHFVGSLEYATDLFDRATVERLANRFRNLLDAAATTPEAGIADLPLLAPAERHQLAVEWSDTAAPYPTATVHQAILHQAARTPDAVAVTCGDEGLTYGELAAAAGRLARRLAQRLSREREPLVGLCLDRTLALPVALLATLQAGGAYVPLDPAYPEERLAFMLEDAGLSLLLIGPGAPEGLCRHAAGVVPVLSCDQPDTVDADVAAGEPVDPGRLAYVLYTSGSTGRPKGVEVPHRALANFLASMRARPGLGGDDVLLAVTSLSFDIAGLELYLPLLAGARVDLASRELAADGARLLARLRETGATVLQATPATWRLLIDAGWQGAPPEPPLCALCGGEALPERLAAELRARAGAVWNLYGPTETTIWSAVARVEGGGVTVGRPIANTRIVLLDIGLRGLRPVPLGAAGELWIGGGGVARGYRNRPGLTAERFAPDPFADQPGARLYRTGDLARCRPDGALEVLGRLDHQVKVRGFRIEPGEVEAALEAEPAVAHAVVAAHGEEGDRQLVAWLVPRGDGSALAPLSIDALRESLGRSLPDSLVPTAWVVVDALPLTPNGKVDRSRLPAPGGSRPAAAYVAPRTALEEVVAGIWAEVLGVERVGVEDNFFTLGGHSLLAARVLSRLGETLEIEVPLRRLFEAPTVGGLTRALLRSAPDGQELEQAARLVLDLLRFSDAEVEELLRQHAAGATAMEEAR